MPATDAIISVITAAINEINETLPRDRKISLQPAAALYGPEGVVDSLTLTLLIVAIEQKIEHAFQRTISLMDFSMLSDDHHAFKNISTLASHIISLIGPQEP